MASQPEAVLTSSLMTARFRGVEHVLDLFPADDVEHVSLPECRRSGQNLDAREDADVGGPLHLETGCSSSGAAQSGAREGNGHL